MKRYALLLLLFISSAHALDPKDLLKPKQAFQVSAVRLSDRSALLTFIIAPGYGLYKDKLAFKSDTGAISPVIAVQMVGENMTMRDDLGNLQLRNVARIRVDFKDALTESSMLVKLQGCADIGLCFNPEVRTVQLP